MSLPKKKRVAAGLEAGGVCKAKGCDGQPRLGRGRLRALLKDGPCYQRRTSWNQPHSSHELRRRVLREFLQGWNCRISSVQLKTSWTTTHRVFGTFMATMDVPQKKKGEIRTMAASSRCAALTAVSAAGSGPEAYYHYFLRQI